MIHLTPLELRQLEELNKALIPASGLTQEQLRARIDGMSLEQIIEDAIQYGVPVSKNTTPSEDK